MAGRYRSWQGAPYYCKLCFIIIKDAFAPGQHHSADYGL